MKYFWFKDFCPDMQYWCIWGQRFPQLLSEMGSFTNFTAKLSAKITEPVNFGERILQSTGNISEFGFWFDSD